MIEPDPAHGLSLAIDPSHDRIPAHPNDLPAGNEYQPAA
jgi:hypothetical protein